MLFQPPAPGSDAHTYSFHLKPGWLLHLSLEQKGADVVARVLAPDGRELFRVDSPNGDKGNEEVWLVASSAGFHSIVVKPWPGSKGRYQARIRAIRRATDKERINAAAERAYHLAFQGEGSAPRAWLEERYLRAARGWESLGRMEREADARYRLGRIRAERGNWRGALEAQRRARELFHLLGARRSEVLSLDGIAEAHQMLGELDEARRIRKEGLLRWKALGETRNVVATSYHLCQLAHLAGRAWEALQCYERVLQDWRKLGDRHREGMVGVDIGTLYASLGDLDRALEAYEKALVLLPEGSPARGIALTQIGSVYLRAGLSWRALLWFKKAWAFGGRASALTGMGLAWQRLGQPARALPLFQRALALFEMPADKATVWCHIGRLHLSLDQPWSAADAFERALSLGDSKARAGALSGLARAARMRGDWNTARLRMEEALDVIESLRSDMGQPMTGQKFLQDLFKATWLASRQDDYAFLIDLLMERHRLEPDRGYDLEALEVNERALARSLADSLGSIGGVSQPWSSLLGADTVLLEYSLGEERSHLWWVAPTGRDSFELPGRAALETAARRLHRLMSNRRTRQAAIDRESLKTAELLLGPVASRLSQQRLVIVAPDILQYVPFEALLIDRHEVVRNPSATVLARLRARSAAREPSQGVGLLGDGVFSALDDRLPSATRASGAENGPRRLPYVDDEVRSVLKRTGSGKVLAATGFDAVPEVALSGALGSFSLLHLLGHGMTDPKRPERSRLLLSLYTRRGLPRPGWLLAKDVREIVLRADVAVLSACRTGLGKEIRGEGLVGLSHSVLAAGASSVVASLWNVDDRATAALMERFYGEMLDRGRPPAEALRLAQLSLRNERRWSSPYYWGGFVLQGDWLNKARAGGSP